MSTDLGVQQTPRPEARAVLARVEPGYESLDAVGTKREFDELNDVLDGLAQTVIHTLDDIVPYLAKMQSLLSQRGSDRKKVLRKAGIPGWTEWVKTYAVKLDCSVRTVQERIRQFHEGRGSGTAAPSTKAKRASNGKRIRLDARQQAALVKAQLATNDLVAALENGGDWQTPLVEYKKAAVTPAKLDTFLSALCSERDWKALLAKFAEAVEECSDRLTAKAKDALHEVQAALEGSTAKKKLPSGQPTGAAKKRARAQRQRKEDGTRSEARAEELPTEDAKKLPSPAIDAPRIPPRGSAEDRREASTASCRPGSRLQNFTLNEDGKWEFDPEVGIEEVKQIPSAQPEVQPLPRAKATTDAGKAYHVKKRILGDDQVDFAIFRRGDKIPYDLYETEREARAVCETLNASPANTIALGAPVPQKADPQPAAESNANEDQNSRTPELAAAAEVPNRKESASTKQKEGAAPDKIIKVLLEGEAKEEADVNTKQSPRSLCAEAREEVANKAQEIIRKAADQHSYSVLKVMLNGTVYWHTNPNLHWTMRFDPGAPQISLLVVGGTKAHKEDKALQKAALARNIEAVRAMALERFNQIRPGFFEGGTQAAESIEVVPGEVEPQVGDWEGTRGWRPKLPYFSEEDRTELLAKLLRRVDFVLESVKTNEVEKDPNHASDILRNRWRGFRMGQLSWMYDADLQKMDKYFEFRSQPILDWAAKASKGGGGDVNKDQSSSSRTESHVDESGLGCKDEDVPPPPHGGWAEKPEAARGQA